MTWIITKFNRILTHCGVTYENDYFQTLKGHVTWIIKKVNGISKHCGAAYESIHLLTRGHVIRVCFSAFNVLVRSTLPELHYPKACIEKKG